MSSFFLLKGWLDWIAFVNDDTHPSGHISKWVSEWVIKSNLQAIINFKKKGIKKEQQKSEGTH